MRSATKTQMEGQAAHISDEQQAQLSEAGFSACVVPPKRLHSMHAVVLLLHNRLKTLQMMGAATNCITKHVFKKACSCVMIWMTSPAPRPHVQGTAAGNRITCLPRRAMHPHAVVAVPCAVRAAAARSR